MNWWNDLSSLQQIMAGIAIPATLIMLIQIIMFIVGFSDSGGSDADMSHTDFHVHDLHPADPHGYNGGMDHSDVDAIKLFTIRSIVAFFSIGGWTGVVLAGSKLPLPAVIVFSLMAGWAALYFVTWSVRMAFRMQESGNVMIGNAVGKTGEVYITIPAANKGCGKINVVVQERFSEFDAQTDAERDIRTGETVIITGVIKDDVLLVMPQDQLDTK